MLYTLKVLKPKPSHLGRLSTQHYLLFMLAALGLYAASASIAARGYMGSPERGVFETVYNLPHLPPFIVLAITQLGSAWFLLALIIIFLVNKSRALAARLAIVGFVTYIMVELSKTLVGRPRPEFLVSDIDPREHFVTGLGFPSGHTALITVIGLMLFPYIPKRWRLLVPGVILLVGLSRIYLGVHAPLDVVGGFAVGVIVALSYYLGTNLAKHMRVAKDKRRA